MKFLPICVILVMCFIAKGSSDSFLCYECENCEETLSDSLLKSCPAATTLPPTTEPTQETTASPPVSIETPSSPPVAIETAVTPPVATETTATPPAAIETPSTPPAATETAVTPPVATETTATPPAAIETPSTPPAATEATTSPSVATEATTSPSVATEATAPPSVATEATASPPAATEATASPPAAVETPDVPPQSGNSNPIGHSIRRSRSLKSVLREESSFHCFSINIKDKEGDGVKTNKGCIEVLGNKDVCDTLTEKYGQSTENCRFCESDRCNSSAAFKISFVIFLITILISVFWK